LEQENNNRNHGSINEHPKSYSREDAMKSNTRRFVTIVAVVAVGLWLAMPLNRAFADSSILERLTAQWWQWALSVPTPVNPLMDQTGEDCVIGQRGSIWFLAGVGIFGGGTAARTCSVPQGNTLVFPVINSVNINAPNVCGQDANNVPVADLRALSAGSIDGAINLSVKLDGKNVKNLLRRVQSQVFEVALPEDNVFDDPCAGLGGVPAGIYSPAVDDGFYMMLPPLKTGKHTLKFHAENPSQSFVEDVTYNITVVPVSLR
jgi:hypothetical protein